MPTPCGQVIGKYRKGAAVLVSIARIHYLELARRACSAYAHIPIPIYDHHTGPCCGGCTGREIEYPVTGCCTCYLYSQAVIYGSCARIVKGTYIS